MAAIATVLSCGVGIYAGVRTQWRALAVAGVVMAALAGVPVVTLWGCIASGRWGPWFSLFPVYAIGLIIAITIALGLLVAVIHALGRRIVDETPHPLASSALLAQTLVLLAQLGVVLWMAGANVPNV
ncbi:MAG: hypothetical protein ACIAS6_14715 [Phycisphaerales bacterium JB060]